MESDAEHRMSVLEHLADLRKRLIIAGSATAATVLLSAFFLTSPIITLLTQPVGIKLAALRPAETFTTYMKVALTAGTALAMPIIIWQGLLFVLPGLHHHERRWIYVGVPAITIAFAIGLTFGFFLVIPF